MKGFRKSILMGAALVLLVSAGAGAMSASEELSESRTERTTESLTETERKISLGAWTGEEQETAKEAAREKPVLSDSEAAAEAAQEVVPEAVTEAWQIEAAQEVPEAGTEAAQTEAPGTAAKAVQEVVPEAVTEAWQTEAAQEVPKAGTEAAQTEAPGTAAEAAQGVVLKAETEPWEAETAQTEEMIMEAAAEAAQGVVSEAVTEAWQTEETQEEFPDVVMEAWQTEAVQTEEMQEDETGAVSVLSIAKRDPAELNDAYLTVTWTKRTEGESPVYEQGKDDAEIEAIDGGIWELYIKVAFQAPYMDPLTDGSYFCRLVWPNSVDPVVSLTGENGDILIGEDFNCGTWTLSKDGELLLTFEGLNDISSGYGWIKTFIQAGEAEAEEPVDWPVNPSVEKEGLYDAAAQKVFWTAEVTVPAWDGGSVYSWSLRDTERITPVSLTECFKNDYSGMTVEGEEGTDWLYEEMDDGRALIWFLNPCTCGEDGCEMEEPGQSGGACGQIKYIDASGQAWCTCWHRRQNSRFTLCYTADTAELQQQMQESGRQEAELINEAVLLQSGAWTIEASDSVKVHQAIRKAESERPDISNHYSSTCRITVNPSFDDYSGAERIEVTDVMENLTYINESLQIFCLYSDGTEGVLTQMDGSEAAALGREGNESRFFSVETAEDGQSFSVSLWYPAQASYTITYRAAVAELVPGAETTYQNTASLGRVSSTVRGKGFQVDDAWFGETFEAVVLKVDADSDEEEPEGLAGAVFEVRQVSGDGEDLLIDTLTTGEDGKDVFRTDRSKGILVNRNTLYYLQETEAPQGYERKEEKYYFYFSPADDMVLPEGITAVKGEKKEDAKIPTYTLMLVVPNQAVPARELPSTGGPSDALFFVIGLFLVVASKGAVLPKGMY